MAKFPINARFRGFICTSAHPTGCAQNVQRQIAIAKAAPGKPVGRVLVIGSSAGYGLSSLITAMWSHGASAISVCFERAAKDDRTASAGWYNLAEVHAQAKAAGKSIQTINGDAFSHAIKEQVLAAVKASGPIDLLVYSLASPVRVDPDSATKYASVLKPIGGPYTNKTVNLDSEQIQPITIQPANEADISNTVKVMGGEDWKLWVDALSKAGLLAKGCRTVAYSYIGPQLTYPIYRAGTIGRAKDDLEATAKRMDRELVQSIGGHAWVSVNKALVTQASSAIPVVPLYISLLYKVMKERGTHEGTIEQMVRLFNDQLIGVTPKLDEAGRIRVDDREMAADVQAAVAVLWETVESGNFLALSDYAGFKHEFRGLYGFELPGIDYAAPVEVDLPLV